MKLASKFNRPWHYVAALAATIFCSTPAVAIELNMLNRCDDLRRLWTTVDSRGSFGTCREPADELEHNFWARLSPDGRQSFCILSHAPAPFLRDFTCVDTRKAVPYGNVLVCFREIPIEDIDRYKAQYETTFADDVSNYLSSSASCTVSNGDSSIAPGSMGSLLINTIARFEFGFVLSLGQGDKAPGYALHEFARLDDLISTDGLEVFEIVSGIVKSPSTDTTPPGVRRGNWYVDLEAIGSGHRSADEQLNEMMKKYSLAVRDQTGVNVQILLANFDVANVSPADDATQSGARRKMLDTVIAALEDYEFDYILEDDAYGLFGMDYDEMADQVAQNILYGQRDQLRVGRLRALVRDASCSAAVEPGVLAMVMDLKHRNISPRNYGSLMLIIVATGRCARDSRVHATVEEALTRARDWLFAYLENEK